MTKTFFNIRMDMKALFEARLENCEHTHQRATHTGAQRSPTGLALGCKAFATVSTLALDYCCDKSSGYTLFHFLALQPSTLQKS